MLFEPQEINSEIDSDIILLQMLEEELQSKETGIIRAGKIREKQLLVEGRIEGLNIALKIIGRE